jgi:hypothetical protein
MSAKCNIASAIKQYMSKNGRGVYFIIIKINYNCNIKNAKTKPKLITKRK